MARRVLAFMIATVVLGAPLAADVCRTACAAHNARYASSGSTHSCHAVSSTSGPTVTAAPHFCGHDDTLPAGSDRRVEQLVQPAILSTPWLSAPLTDGPSSIDVS